MALHPKFPKSPYEILEPEYRWFPADEALRKEGYEKLLPPLVAQLRLKVKEWRETDYSGATETSKALLHWWFRPDYHPNFRYYFAQQEAVETIIYLCDVAKVKDKYDLIRYDSSGAVSAGMFDEDWRRFVVKMATGSGKTKVLSLVLAWSYFHKLYEPDSNLARNFLIITPNIIVLDRIKFDFLGLKIFFQDPILPEDGYEGRNWRDDFQLTIHVQDEVGQVRKTGNIFLTNIHRVFESNGKSPSAEDVDTTNYFLGSNPVNATNESKVDLAMIVRDVDELVVLNDEAHHIHDPQLAWFKSIADIHNRLKMKGSGLTLQVDTTATPKHNNGAIFVQTVTDYPLVEAIAQDIVKHPVLPDLPSRAKLVEKKSVKFSERFADYIHLGYLEWKKVYEEHKHLKKAVFFVMTDDTKNCDEVADYLQRTYQEFSAKDNVLVIHTKNNGEISETATGKSKEELDKLRDAANTIDKADSPCRAIVSVLMLKEGWDVRNVTTIVGLRPYSAKSNILPEQTLGRGLRRMYPEQNVAEQVSVVGTDAFMKFVESIKSEGVELEHRSMGAGTSIKAPLVVEIDKENKNKDLEKLDIEIPILSPRNYREYKNLSELNPASFGNKRFPVKKFSEAEKREIVFKDITTEEISHKTILESDAIANYQSVVGYFTQTIQRELRLVSGYDILFSKVKEFITSCLFETSVDLEDLNILRNLSELEVTRTIIETFKQKINDLTILDRGEAEVRHQIKVSQCRPYVVKDQPYLISKKSPFNKVVVDNNFERDFAAFLENSEDVISFAKNYQFMSARFGVDYKSAEGTIANFYPDFVVKTLEGNIYFVETKGREDPDDPIQIKRLRQWCEDVKKVQKKDIYKMLYVRQEDFGKYKVKNFSELYRLLGSTQ